MGDFVLERPLGRGGMAVVWAASHVDTGFPVAVKFMVPGSGGVSVAAAARFRQEVRAVAGLQHPHITRVYDVGRVGAGGVTLDGLTLPEGCPWLVMERAELGALSAQGAPLDWPTSLAVLGALLDALAHAHARGVVHRDIKPQNVLLSRATALRPGLKLTDFGIAQAMRGAAVNREISGSPRFMAPEQFRPGHGALGPWTDLYALGVVAFWLVTGQPPYSGTPSELAVAHTGAPLPPLIPRIAVPPGFESWALQLLAKRPRDRFQRAAHAARALHELGSATAGVPDLAASPRAQRRSTVAWAETVVESRATATLAWEPLPSRRETPASAALARASSHLPRDWRSAADPVREHESRRLERRGLPGVGAGIYELREVTLVGREAERDLLWGDLEEVHTAQRPRLVVIEGAAGSGKTRLARWLVERSHEVGAADALTLRFERDTNGAPLVPVVLAQALAGELGCAGASPEQATRRLERLLGRPADDVQVVAAQRLLAPALAPIPSDQPPQGRSSGGPPRGWLEGLRPVLAALFGGAQERTVVFVFDDGASEGGLELASQLLADRAARTLCLLTVSDEALADVHVADRVDRLCERVPSRRLRLEPLERPERARLSRDLLGLAPALAAEVEARTAGNPGLIIATVADLLRRDALELLPEGLRPRDGVAPSFPEGLQTAWDARLEALLGTDPDVVAVFQLVAVGGGGVDAGTWAEMTEHVVAGAGRVLDRLVAARVVAPTPDGGWRFTQPMFREALMRRTADGGAMVVAAEWHIARIVATGRGTGGAASEALAHLLPLAGRPAEALDPLLDAALDRHVAGDLRGSLARLERARPLIDVLADDDPRRGRWLTQLASSKSYLGDRRQAQELAERARDAARQHGWLPTEIDATLLLARLETFLGNPDVGVALYEDALAKARLRTDSAATGWCLLGLADVARKRRALPDAERFYRESADCFQAVGDRARLGEALRGRALVHRARGEYAAAERLQCEALGAFQAAGWVYGSAAQMNDLADLARHQGRLEEARELYGASSELFEQLGGEVDYVVQLNLAIVHVELGEFPEALSLLDAIREPLRQRGARLMWCGVNAVALACHAHAQAWARWDDDFAEVEAVIAATGMTEPDLAGPFERAGELAAQAGDHERARAVWELSLAQWRGLDRRVDAERVEGRLAAWDSGGGIEVSADGL